MTLSAPVVKLTVMTVVTDSAALVAMAFTPSEITAITIASGALIATVFTGIVNIITALRTERKVTDISAKADVITGHVNSAATASTSKLEAMQQQIDQLTRLLSESKETAAVLAQSVAAVKPVVEVLSEHDTWEKKERKQLDEKISENTRLTQEILDAVVKTKNDSAPNAVPTPVEVVNQPIVVQQKKDK